MKSIFNILSFILISSLFLVQCKDDDAYIFRAYVEGKITYSDGEFLQNPIQLINNKKIIAETYPKESGSFVLAGPYDKGAYKLQLKNFKIKSFSTETPNCKISSDSLSIEIPDGVTYIILNDITLK